jgi:hypothetical protein
VAFRDWWGESEHDPGITLVEVLAWLAAGIVVWRRLERRRPPWVWPGRR